MTPLKAVSLSKLKAVYDHMAGRVKYVYGAKAPSIDCDSHDINGIDCSGFTRYALAKATNGGMVLPDGSQVQLEWAEKHLRKLKAYSDLRHTEDDSTRLFIAFLRVTRHRAIGHVWLIREGETLESHGGTGVDSRGWDTHPLLSSTDCFEIMAEA